MNYIEAYRHEGGLRGIKILVSTDHQLTDKENEVISRAADGIWNALWLTEETLKPNDKEEMLKSLLNCFGGRNIFIEQIPNEYCSQPCCIHRPWLIVTTSIGHIKIGWRKRVIVIDWSNTAVGKSAETLFPNEDTTKEGPMIHAWGYEKAKEYIEVLHG